MSVWGGEREVYNNTASYSIYRKMNMNTWYTLCITPQDVGVPDYMIFPYLDLVV